MKFKVGDRVILKREKDLVSSECYACSSHALEDMLKLTGNVVRGGVNPRVVGVRWGEEIRGGHYLNGSLSEGSRCGYWVYSRHLVKISAAQEAHEVLNGI